MFHKMFVIEVVVEIFYIDFVFLFSLVLKLLKSLHSVFLLCSLYNI